jgi:large subunit ribosomal protein L4e
MKNSINTGHARLPRLKNRRVLMSGRVAGVSQAVGGPKAHPPKISKILIKKINSKEKTKAILSALSATANSAIIGVRGHIVPEKLTFPVVIEDSLEKIQKTKEVSDFLEKLGLDKDIEKAKLAKTFRAGRGKTRGRRYKRKKSILFVLGNNTNYKYFKNLEGVDVVSARQLSVKELAPGTHAGRLTIFSKSAIDELNKRFSKVI